MKFNKHIMIAAMVVMMVITAGCGGWGGEGETCNFWPHDFCRVQDVDVSIIAGDTQLKVTLEEPPADDRYIDHLFGTVSDGVETRKFMLGIGELCDTLINYDPDYNGSIDGAFTYREESDIEGSENEYVFSETEGERGYLDGSYYSIETSFIGVDQDSDDKTSAIVTGEADEPRFYGDPEEEDAEEDVDLEDPDENEESFGLNTATRDISMSLTVYVEEVDVEICMPNSD